MTQATQFTIGSEALCTDGACGKVTRVVVDPVARAVTHLVVEPKHGFGIGRLVPVDLVEAASDVVQLRCTSADFEKLERAEEMQFLPGTGAFEGYSPQQVLSWPYYSLGVSTGVGVGVGEIQPLVVDKVPVGEVALRRGEPVHATDGEIGRVQGLVIDPNDRHVTHVLLQEGHMWGRREVAIPIEAVARIEDGIRLSITKKEVEDLPRVDVDHPHG